MRKHILYWLGYLLLLGGGIGGTIGMFFFHHKTRH